MTSTQTSTPQPQREGVGKLILIGMVLGVIIAPLAVYFAIDLFGQVGPACNAVGGNEDRMSCAARQIIMSGMAIPVGAVLGFAVSYWIALRRWK